MPKTALQKLVAVPDALQASIARTRVSYRQLGRSGLRVSNPILGVLLAARVCLPVQWDTANVYSNGESEKIIGKALQTFNIPRHKVIIMTKCYRVVCDAENHDPASGVTMHHDLADNSKDYVNQWGLSRSAIFSAVEASLRRLNTHYIDVLQIHRFDTTVSPKEVMGALHDLVRSGMVRYIGASSMWAYQFAMMQNVAEQNGWTAFVSMQNHYNLLYREEEREMNKYCEATGVGLIPWGPLAHGRLARPPNQPPSTLRGNLSSNGSLYGGDDRGSDLIISRVAEVAAKRGWPMSHVALAWLNRRCTSPVIGFSTVDRMDDILAARDKVLTPEEEHYLEELYLARPVEGHA
ncbi:hypothetical protein NLG97_g1390 [Lecanicillium saksenae]|uniref:Uncharacterized protein n=1 Tax=Lecanicillium saksenae TaxID=468837 RepID=A0ACC1R5M3_9HYPO|nr:hypothetical protein NLG97_g1390 [Lecanicillium saksenae]